MNTETLPRMDAARTEPAVIARFADRRAAADAVDALSRAGVDGSAIAVLGGEGTRRHDAGSAREAQRRTDASSTRRIGRRFGAGAIVGAVLGAAFGALVVGWLVSAGPTGLLSGAVVGALAGLGLGALTGLQSTPTMASAWGNALGRGADGGVVLSVQTDDHDVQRLERMLQDAGATTTRTSP